MLITINDSKASATIDSLGAQLVSFMDAAKKEYIWQRDPGIWPRCSPLLFPSVGNCRNGKTMFEGQWYDMPKHGIARDYDFTVTSQGEASATFLLVSNETMKQNYPYDFTLSLTYALQDGVLSICYRVTNPQDTPLFYCIGAHPGFICPMEERASFQDYQLVFAEKEQTASIVYDMEQMAFDPHSKGIVLENTDTLLLDYQLFAHDAIYFDRLRSRKVSLVHQKTGRGIEMAYPDFESIAFWTPYGENAPFLCLEPWNGSAIRTDEDDEFTHKYQVQLLEAGEEKSYSLYIRIL